MKNIKKLQNDFCNYPDKFYGQKFEDIDKLTYFHSEIYLFNTISNEILKAGKFEPNQMPHFLDILLLLLLKVLAMKKKLESFVIIFHKLMKLEMILCYMIKKVKK